MDKHFTIVIQRQFGSQGRNIAKLVAKKLGIKFYDRTIVEKVATTLGMPVSQIADEEDSKSHPPDDRNGHREPQNHLIRAVGEVQSPSVTDCADGPEDRRDNAQDHLPLGDGGFLHSGSLPAAFFTRGIFPFDHHIIFPGQKQGSSHGTKPRSGGGNGPVLLAIRREKGYDGRQKTGSPLARAERKPARL